MRTSCVDLSSDNRGAWCQRYSWRIDGKKTNCDTCPHYRAGRPKVAILPLDANAAKARKQVKNKEDSAKKKTHMRGGMIRL